MYNDTMGDMGRFRFKLPNFRKILKKLPHPPVPPSMPVPIFTGQFKNAIPGFATRKRVIYHPSPSAQVFAPSATAASQPVPQVTAQPFYDNLVYPSGTSPDYQTPQTPMVAAPPSASIMSMSYDSGTPQETYSNDIYTSPSSPSASMFSMPESPADNADYWGNENEMQGLGATTDTSWYQDLIPQLTQAYTQIKAAQQAAKTPATLPSRPMVISQPSAFNLNTMLMVGAVGLGGLLLFTMMRKKRR